MKVVKFESIKELIEFRGKNNSSELFICSPEDGIKLTFGEYYNEIVRLNDELIKIGIKKGDKIAILLFNGLNYAVSIMSVITMGGTAVPINPNLKISEVEYLLKNSKTKFVITDIDGINALNSNSKYINSDIETLNIKLNYNKKIKIIKLKFSDIEDESKNLAFKDDEAILLYTSGTTGRPKGVILTNYNLLSEAQNIQIGHKLTQHDVTLCILPLFHINGLVVSLISPLFSGGKVVIPRKFSARKFWQWIEHYKVTWFSAVPTIFSIILSKPVDKGNDLSSLRFARSASAPLPLAVLNEFEQKFGIPVIESYGISEASSQVTTNPLPPLTRKHGSVGRPIGNKIKIVDKNGENLPLNSVGEILINGSNVTKGYYNNSIANIKSFKNGWFCTDDLGYIDEDGYLFIKGRIKELINRAGEKISPREVDEVLYSLSVVEMAAAVGVPDSFYGEEVVAFIKLKSGKKIEEQEIMDFCKNYLADFKIPKKIFFIDDFPKGPSGKIQRKKLVNTYINMKKLEKRRDLYEKNS